MGKFISDLLGRFNEQKKLKELEGKMEHFTFPTDLTNPLIDYMLERSYLNDMAERDAFVVEQDAHREPIGWIRINRLPVKPGMDEDYDLLTRWQSVISSVHIWQSRLYFLLQRENGQTRLYLGLQGSNKKEVAARMRSALTNSMRGIDLENLNMDMADDLTSSLSQYNCMGAVTGIPSFRKETEYKELQTLDQLAFGLTDVNGDDVNFSLLVIADPLSDDDVQDIIRRYQKLGSDIHTEVHASIQESKSMGTSRQNNISMGAILGMFANMIPALGPIAATLYYGQFGQNNSKNVGVSESITRDFLNKFAEYTEKQTDMHCERLRHGRNLGFWNVGTYVLGQMDRDVTTALGILRSVYSGDISFLEPIRIHMLKGGTSALTTVRDQFSLIPLITPEAQKKEKDEWHILGKPYQYLSTPLNTEELSLITSLPRKDVPGLRFVKTSVRFANNPGELSQNDTLELGHIVDTGIVQKKNSYKIDINALVRHALVVGSTGCGKTTTCKTMINTVLDRQIPMLIIEPAKDEYVRWAIKQRQAGRKVNIFMPGVKTLEGERIQQLKLNPFQPAAIEGAPIDMMTRCEQLTALVNASLPTSDVLPVIIDESFFNYLLTQPFGEDFLQGEMNQLDDYPKLDGVLPIARKMLKARGYSEEISNGLVAALETRFAYLTRGKRGEILNVRHSTPWHQLFNETTVINLSKIANAKDRALIMSIILLALYEYRISAYLYDSDYQRRAQENKLLHLTVVEEAHNVLMRPSVDQSGSGNPQQVVADLFGNMLSEIRAYGQGLMVIDQVPTRLIPDVLKNTTIKICHRLAAAEDAQVMADALALRPDQKDIIPTLAQGHAIIASDRDDAASWVKVNKPKILL